ncbi:MAG: hypothetical protein HOP08_17140 [Cyclobacteriaceae bacterium]|nr:hypothetical protein [Cyclobacteriaceae bacterium]
MIKYCIFLLMLLFIDPPGKITKVNSAKAEAKKAYLAGDYKAAVAQYKLLDSLGVKEDEVSMNLAHSYFQLKDTTNAQNSYQSLTTSANPKFRSVANQQLGVLNNRNGKFEEALNYFKSALKADPANEEARYNYEMLKKKLEEKKKEEEKQKQQDKDQKKDDEKKDDKDNKDNKDQKKHDQQKKDDQKKKDQEKKDQDKKDQEEKEQKEKEQKEKEEKENKDPKDEKEKPPSTSKKLKDMKISEEKAKMVLEAMKNQEVQYLQQNKRKATKPKSKGKPDW